MAMLNTPYSRPEYIAMPPGSVATSPVPVAQPKKRIAQRRFSSTIRKSFMRSQQSHGIDVDHQGSRIPFFGGCKAPQLAQNLIQPLARGRFQKHLKTIFILDTGDRRRRRS